MFRNERDARLGRSMSCEDDSAATRPTGDVTFRPYDPAYAQAASGSEMFAAQTASSTSRRILSYKQGPSSVARPLFPGRELVRARGMIPSLPTAPD